MSQISRQKTRNFWLKPSDVQFIVPKIKYRSDYSYCRTTVTSLNVAT